MTLTEGHYKKNWLNISTYSDNTKSILVDKLQLKTPQTLSVGVGNQTLRSVTSSGATVYSIGVHRSLLESDLRCSLLELNFPNSGRYIKISNYLRYNIINRIKLLLSSEMNREEFHMEAIDLVVTILSTTSLKPEFKSNTSRVRLVHRSMDNISTTDPRLLSPSKIAQLSYASVRTLEYPFRELLGITPKQYIDCYRINLLRERLIASPHIPIIQIGLEIGLPHLGNLSKNYKALYGETPSVTKRRLAGQ
ncbi:MAG: AraC family ethanolamine operon transcriptional activator [Flavobacterium sp.]|jgi:AraC family ethanolamine operon transcriptional activator